MNTVDLQYIQLANNVLKRGSYKQNRTGIATYSIFGDQMFFDMREGFPLITTKKVHFKSIVHELLWFIKGDTNTRYLTENGVSIWNEWATDDGDLGPIYGRQWRNWNGHIDQLKNVINNIILYPESRRHIVSSWNAELIPDETLSPQQNVEIGLMSLAPCHLLMQFNCDGPYLDLQMYQRSVDVFLGLPFNIASYSLLLLMVSQITDKLPRNFIWTGGDIHIYENHIEQIIEQSKRSSFNLPTVFLNKKIYDIDKFKYEDVILRNYEAHPPIKADIAV